jgi:hypothetical protein
VEADQIAYRQVTSFIDTEIGMLVIEGGHLYRSLHRPSLAAAAQGKGNGKTEIVGRIAFSAARNRQSGFRPREHQSPELECWLQPILPGTPTSKG